MLRSKAIVNIDRNTAMLLDEKPTVEFFVL